MNEEEANTPCCLLCSTHKNYCFNSDADDFGLIEINRKRKQVSRWLSSLVVSDRITMPGDKFYVCEVHYAKDEIIRCVDTDGCYGVRLASEQVVPCYVRMEERALNNRINSFLCLTEDYEKCLNLGEKWICDVRPKKLMLTMEEMEIRISVADNLTVQVWEKEELMELKFAVDVGYLEPNQRILFWSRLRGLMKYFESLSPCKIVVTPDLDVPVPVPDSPEQIKRWKIIKAVPLPSKKEKIDEIETPRIVKTTFRVFKGTKLPQQVTKVPTTVPPLLMSSLDKYEEEITSLPVLIDVIKFNPKPNWVLVVTYKNLCLLNIIIPPSAAPFIQKSLKVESMLQVSAYINTTKVINNLINKTPGEISTREFLHYWKSLDNVPVNYLPELQEKNLKLEPKLESDPSPDENVYGIITSFEMLLDNLQAFVQNAWNPTVFESDVLIFKIDTTEAPKFKRYLHITRSLQLSVFNNGVQVPFGDLIPEVQPYPLTITKIHMILAKLDETVFETILRPSKYRDESKSSFHSMMTEYRVVPGIKKRHKCSLCTYESNTLNYVKQHYEIKHTPPDRKCPECGKEMNATQLKIHARFHIKKVKCHVCNKGFADSRDLKKHVNVHNKKAADCVPPVKPLAAQNNQLPLHLFHSEDNFPVITENKVKLEEIASVTHPINDMLDIDQIKLEVEDDEGDCVMES